MRKGSYYTGTSGLVLPYKNKQFYPEPLRDKSRLEVYGTLFNTIEINSSFYNIPMHKTMQRWAISVPDHFRFTFKLWQGITHVRDLDFKPADVTRFMEVIAGVGEKKGCLLIQLPPSLRAGALQRVAQLLAAIKEADPDAQWRLAVEFRHLSWYREETYHLLNTYNATMVVHDKANVGSPLEEMDADFVYARFHGPEGNYRSSYEDSYLYEYASYVRDWLHAGKDVYAYFNNTIGDAINDLQVLETYVRERK
ncbi:DUF72 domain-containing protein [Chitinophaga sp. sic0106]|uniref:DUF72 domain-containing protein n=1 Tax=Chitinophaga sp. sic0106 TaxID=2854785 RepID=UPI001C47E9F9|nr:DUF72 domain-containing protein [Chitinophaga sp. sic0106]MBV7530348.1 DUF72 domain-containing protein [Chitinophaga sp. sic0106]